MADSGSRIELRVGLVLVGLLVGPAVGVLFDSSVIGLGVTVGLAVIVGFLIGRKRVRATPRP